MGMALIAAAHKIDKSKSNPAGRESPRAT